MKNESKIKLPFSIDDLFTTQEQRDDMKKEKIEQIDIKLLDSFTNHPFNVIENSELEKLEKSISENGVLEPIIVRKKDNDRYEIISGHRRKKASEIIGLDKLPCIIREMSDDEATIYMVDSNMHRERLLPSEKAFAYKMKLEAIKNRINDTSVPVGQKIYSRQLLSNEVSDSSTNIQRYIRLTNLIPQLLEYVDNIVLDKTPSIALRPAVELSFLKNDEQLMLYNFISFQEITPSYSQAIRLRKLSEEGKLDDDVINEIMSEEKANQIPKIKLSMKDLKQILPENIDNEHVEDFLKKAIKHYTNYLKKRKIIER